VIPLNSES